LWLATCHTGGNQKAGKVDCAIIANNDRANSKTGFIESDPIYNHADCSKSTVTHLIIENENNRGWLVGASGGSMGGVAIGKDACTSATLVTTIGTIFKK